MDRAKERTKWKFKWRKSSNANRSWSVNRKKDPKSQNKTQHNKNSAEPEKSSGAHTIHNTHTHMESEGNAIIFIIISILAERFQSISSDITKSIATLILSKHQFYWYFNPINYIFTSISGFFLSFSASPFIRGGFSVVAVPLFCFRMKSRRIKEIINSKNYAPHHYTRNI